MIGALHDDARERDEPVAMLTASESAIYGRFGYGIATWRMGVTAERAHVRFLDTDERGGRMRMVTQAEGEKLLPPLYERMRTLRAGSVSRPDYWWPTVFWGHLDMKKKASFVAVHSDAQGNDDGFVAYEIAGEWRAGLPDAKLVAYHVEGVDAQVRAALWRYLFGVDLCTKVHAVNVPVDEPLRYLISDSRRVRVDYVNDGLWVAPLDPAPYLAARRYAIDGSLVIEVHAPDGTSQRYALEGGPDGAQCAPSTATADVACTTAVLGACSLGGNRWSDFAQAGRVEGDTAVLDKADLMFGTTPAPALFTNF
jgi:predicted acetyltransferase